MKNFGKIISDKDIITKEYLDSKGYISAITSKMVTDALGFTPFDSAAFTKTSIKNALGIADWALAANKPSYDDVYLKMAGGTITGNLRIIGGFRAESQHGHYINFDGFSLTANAGLKVVSGYSLSLAGESITSWAGLKSILGLGSLAYKNSIEAGDISSIAWSKITGKPTTLSGYGITDAYTKGTADSTFLKLSGGTMTSGAGIYNAANSNTSEGAIGFNSNHNAFGSTTFATKIRSSINPTVKLPSGEFAMLHSGNFGDFNLAVWSNNIDVSSNSSFKHIGSANAGNGWTSVGGPAMAFGANGSNYVKLIFPNYNDYYQRRIYYKHIKGGVEATSWGEILTKDNFSAYGLALKTDSSSWSPTDAGAFVGYTTGINGWATAGIAAALAYANYTGLLNFAGGTDGNVGLYVSNSHNGVMRAWEKVLTDKTLAKFASSNDLTAEGKWKIDITGMADKFGVEYTGNLDTNSRNGLAHYNTGTTGRPSNYGMVMQMANVSNPVPGTAEHWITQIASSTYNDLYYRIRINTGAWQGWRKILTDGNIGTTSLPSLNLNGETITSWDDVGAIQTVYQTATSGTVSIAPNVLNKWSSALTGTLTITFASGSSGVANYYMLEFTTGSSIPTINLPSGVKWEGGYNILNNLAANTTYQISILNNLAVGGAF